MNELTKIHEIEYKGFKTEFYITGRVKQYLKENNVDHDKFLDDEYHWYEVFLFELIDEDLDGEPDKKFGKNFKVVYCGIITRLNKDLTEEGFEEDFEHDEDKVLSEGSTSVNHEPLFAIKYKVSSQ